jgi:opacity protein-like surface antigen
LILALTCAAVLGAARVEAQPALYVGMLTPHIGVAAGGDIRERGVTPGVSLAVLDTNGIGAEVDLGHSRRVDADRFSESAVTSLMVNFLGMWMRPPVRPFVVAGAGLLRVRTAIPNGVTITSRTELGLSAGAGASYIFNDIVGVRGDVRYFRYFQRHPDLPLLDNGFFDFWRTSFGVTLSWTIQ